MIVLLTTGVVMKFYTATIVMALLPDVDATVIDEGGLWRILGEKCHFSLQELSNDLVKHGLLSIGYQGKPEGYRNLYRQERERGIRGVGHFLNTANRIFTQYRKERAS
jgi:hypothetical protein